MSERLARQRVGQGAAVSLLYLDRDALVLVGEMCRSNEHEFQPASSFLGRRPGFVFKHDLLGVGYYIDSGQDPALFADVDTLACCCRFLRAILQPLRIKQFLLLASRMPGFPQKLLSKNSMLSAPFPYQLSQPSFRDKAASTVLSVEAHDLVEPRVDELRRWVRHAAVGEMLCEYLVRDVLVKSGRNLRGSARSLQRLRTACFGVVVRNELNGMSGTLSIEIDDICTHPCMDLDKRVLYTDFASFCRLNAHHVLPLAVGLIGGKGLETSCAGCAVCEAFRRQMAL